MSTSSTPFVNKAFNEAQKKAAHERHEFLLPEHLLYALLEQEPFLSALEAFETDTRQLWQKLEKFFQEEVERVPDEINYQLELSGQMNEIVHIAYLQVEDSSARELDVPHLVQGLLKQKESWATHLLKEQINGNEADFMQELIAAYQAYDENWDHGQEEENSRQEAWRNYAKPNWNVPFRYCVARKRIIRSMSANRVWERLHWLTDWPPASKTAMSPNACNTHVSMPSTWEACWQVLSSEVTSKNG